MREIKFRGKRIDNGEWIFGSLIGDNVIVGKIVEWDSEYFCTEFWLKVEPETVGQYTGLKDKNGAEIYEGDILSWRNYKDDEFVGVVTERPGVTYIDWKKPAEYPSFLYEAGVTKMEVIGNIYDHPHLLEVQG